MSRSSSTPRRRNNALPPGRTGNRFKLAGLGLPCANCKLYYAADLDACPVCNGAERVSATAVALAACIGTTNTPGHSGDQIRR